MLTFIYTKFYNVLIPLTLSFSKERFTRPLDALTIANICAMLISGLCGPVAGKVVVEGLEGS